MNEDLVAGYHRRGGVDVHQVLLAESGILSFTAIRTTPPPSARPIRKPRTDQLAEEAGSPLAWAAAARSVQGPGLTPTPDTSAGHDRMPPTPGRARQPTRA